MRRGWIGAVSGVGNQHRASMRSGGAVTLIEKCTDDHDPGHLTVHACGWLQRYGRQAGDFCEVLLELVNHFERALCILFVSQRVQVGEAGDSRHTFVETRVVFHGARSEGVHAEIDRVVPGGHANEVTYHVDFAHFRHAFEIIITTKLVRDAQLDFLNIERRQAIPDATGLRSLEDELLVRTDMSGDFSNRHKSDRTYSSVSAWVKRSICLRLFVSVTQTRKSFGRSGINRDNAIPPSIPFSLPSRASSSTARPGPRTTNSLKYGPVKGTE